MLHETAVSWIRRREKTCRVVTPWKETPAQFSTRLKQVVQDINEKCKVDALCHRLPKRIDLLLEAEGDRLKY